MQTTPCILSILKSLISWFYPHYYSATGAFAKRSKPLATFLMSPNRDFRKTPIIPPDEYRDTTFSSVQNHPLLKALPIWLFQI